MLYYFTLPATAVLAPRGGSTLSGTAVSLSASASSDGFGITKLQFVLSGGPYSKMVIVGHRAQLCYYLRLEQHQHPNGTYRLQSLATDGAGKTSYSPAITIKVDN